MKNSTVIALLLIFCLAASPCLGYKKIERVDSTGIIFFFNPIGGQWKEAPEKDIFGFPNTYSTYFRLDGDDGTVFRGLGQENELVQLFFPTSHSRANLQEVMAQKPAAYRYLKQFDDAITGADMVKIGGYLVSEIGFVVLIAGGLSGSGSGITAGAVLMMGGVAASGFVSPMMSISAFGDLNKAVKAFNGGTIE